MQHRTDTDAGADVCRAGRQVAELGAEGELQFLFEHRIGLIDGAPGLAKLQSGAERLHPQVILLVDHHAERFLAVQHQATAGAFGGMLPADEMALDQNLLVQGGKVIHRFGKSVLHVGQRLDRWPD